MSSGAKRSLVVNGHKTSVSLEDDFWDRLKVIAAERSATLSALASEIDGSARKGSLSSAIRLFVLRDTLARCGAGAT